MNNQTDDPSIVFFFNGTATTEIYTLSLHGALPILVGRGAVKNPERELDSLEAPLAEPRRLAFQRQKHAHGHRVRDRKSTRLNSSHANISYAVFCLIKKQILINNSTRTYLLPLL